MSDHDFCTRCRLDYDTNGECFCDHVNEGTQDR